MGTDPDTAQEAQDRAAARSAVEAAFWRLAGPWWTFLLTGIAWLIISVIVLRFTITSVATVGVLLGVIFLAAALTEFLSASGRSRWPWAHLVLGLLFVAGAVWAFLSPFNAFWALAFVIGLLLILRGSLDLIVSVEARALSNAWWLGVIAGILQILVGFWASQQLYPARAVLLIVWVGFLALFAGISQIALAFELKRR
jgi:uncharacterized membrane protein HdeD (DUF308 family)